MTEETESEKIDLVIGCCILVAIIMIPISMIVGNGSREDTCKAWVGKNYVYHNSHCYRVKDGQTSYVDVILEKKLKRLEEIE